MIHTSINPYELTKLESIIIEHTAIVAVGVLIFH